MKSLKNFAIIIKKIRNIFFILFIYFIIKLEDANLHVMLLECTIYLTIILL